MIIGGSPTNTGVSLMFDLHACNVPATPLDGPRRGQADEARKAEGAFFSGSSGSRVGKTVGRLGNEGCSGPTRHRPYRAVLLPVRALNVRGQTANGRPCSKAAGSLPTLNPEAPFFLQARRVRRWQSSAINSLPRQGEVGRSRDRRRH